MLLVAATVDAERHLVTGFGIIQGCRQFFHRGHLLLAKGNDDVNFAVYETADGARTIYALNINWWEHQASTIEITENGSARTVELAASELVEL